MYLAHDVDVSEYEEYEEDGFKDVLQRRLLDSENSSKRFAMRCYVIRPGGHTAEDVHPHEHGVYMMEGTATLNLSKKEIELEPGDVVHISSYEPHQFRNNSSSNAKFLCVRNYSV
ncbi:MAG: cupin domain-containing protein [Candidatus Thorarchaeota archaeon]|nr:MAG: cupin domain-containing protein [Candidatus Thorarchaeota archaeon]